MGFSLTCHTSFYFSDGDGDVRQTQDIDLPLGKRDIRNTQSRNLGYDKGYRDRCDTMRNLWT